MGSSARIRLGLFTSARAMATRCCWPPESSCGWARVVSFVEADVEQCLARASAALGALQASRTSAAVRRFQVPRCAPRGCIAEKQTRACCGADRLADRSQRRDVDAVEQVAARRRVVQAADEIHEGGLPRTRRPHDCGKLAGLQGKRNPVDRGKERLSGREESRQIARLRPSASRRTLHGWSGGAIVDDDAVAGCERSRIDVYARLRAIDR